MKFCKELKNFEGNLIFIFIILYKYKYKIRGVDLNSFFYYHTKKGGFSMIYDVSISWNKKDLLIYLYFKLDKSDPLMSISFMPDVFFSNWKGSLVSDYKEIAESLIRSGLGGYQKVQKSWIIDAVADILRLYSLTPTVIKRAMAQSKKRVRKVYLKVKQSEVDRELTGRCGKRGGARVKGSGIGGQFAFDEQLSQHLNGVLNMIVKKSASECTYQYFYQFLEVYLEWQIAAGLRAEYRKTCGKKEERSILKIYQQRVKELQVV